MRLLRHIAALVLALGAAGCGNLENAPLRVGTVQGRLTESQASMALVSVVGAPGLRSSVAADGRFTLERVPVGPAELLVIATPEKAMRLPVTVQGGRAVSLGDVVPRAAGFLDVRVKAPGKLRVSGGVVSVEGTPFQRLQLDEKGRQHVGPLAEGCYSVAVAAPGFPAVRTQACVGNGEAKEVKVDLEAPGGNGPQRCAEAGCVDGSRCAPNGQCVECYEDAHCGAGLTCRGFRCEGERPQCASCAGNWQCGGGSSCQDLPEGTAACVAACDAKTPCGQGFSCQGGRCLPDSAQFESCHSYWLVGSTCDGDERCRAQGLVNGLCVAGACTYGCTTDRECPHGFSCEDTLSGPVCQPRKQ
jgi:hypothetical protein